MLTMSGAKRTPGIKSIHMCPGGGEKAEGMSRLSLPCLFVTLFVCPVERCEKYMHTPRQSVKETYRVRSTYYTGIKIPNIGGSDFQTRVNLIIGVTLCIFSLCFYKKKWPSN